MAAKPKISVITPSYNQGKYLKQTIDSVLAQRYPNFEHIVIDGGSTDDSISILRSYSHLAWMSEKDRGQSDALNKALGMAKGQIIAWINSDDWYAPNAFKLAVEALEHFPVVMGAGAVTDADGKPLFEVPNYERNWFDLLKYWVQYSIPTQPSIFFRRDILRALERHAGELLDPDLHYTMDYDLWMRMSIESPFINRIPEVLAFNRWTDSNKTGPAQGGLSWAEPEMSLVFRRAESLALAPTTTFSIVVPYPGSCDLLRAHLIALFQQSIKDFEIIVIDFNCSIEESKSIKSLAAEINASQREAGIDRYVRIIKSEQSSLPGALQDGIEKCEGRFIVALSADTSPGSDLLLKLAAIFTNNRVGIIYPARISHTIAQTLKPVLEGPQAHHQDCDLQSLLLAPHLPMLFAARRIALLEVGEFENESNSEYQIRRLLSRLLFKGWRIVTQAELPIAFREGVESPAVPSNTLEGYIAKIVAELADEYANDPFAKVRADGGWSLVFQEDLIKQAQTLVQIGKGK